MSEKTKASLPSIAYVLNSKHTSQWLKSTLQSALDRDIVGAAHDAKLLYLLLRAELDKLVAGLDN